MGSAEQRKTTWWLVGIAAAMFVLHLALGNRYGFHRDELQFLDDARHLQWGFVPHSPLISAHYDLTKADGQDYFLVFIAK